MLEAHDGKPDFFFLIKDSNATRHTRNMMEARQIRT